MGLGGLLVGPGLMASMCVEDKARSAEAGSCPQPSSAGPGVGFAQLGHRLQRLLLTPALPGLPHRHFPAQTAAVWGWRPSSPDRPWAQASCLLWLPKGASPPLEKEGVYLHLGASGEPSQLTLPSASGQLAFPWIPLITLPPANHRRQEGPRNGGL